MKDNPSGIGSSKAFEALTHVVPPPHQKEVHEDSTISHGTDFEEGQTEMASIEVHVIHNKQPADHIDAHVKSHISVISLDTTHIEKSQTSFHMLLRNVADEIVRHRSQSPLNNMILEKIANEQVVELQKPIPILCWQFRILLLIMK